MAELSALTPGSRARSFLGGEMDAQEEMRGLRSDVRIAGASTDVPRTRLRSQRQIPRALISESSGSTLI